MLRTLPIFTSPASSFWPDVRRVLKASLSLLYDVAIHLFTASSSKPGLQLQHSTRSVMPHYFPHPLYAPTPLHIQVIPFFCRSKTPRCGHVQALSSHCTYSFMCSAGSGPFHVMSLVITGWGFFYFFSKC